MELYFAPLACSLATRIALYEAGAEARFTKVDLRAKRVEDGADFFAVNPMGQVPVLRADTGELITENPVVLQYVADRYPRSGLAAAEGIERYRVQQWLAFIGSELQKVIFIPLLAPTSTEGAKEFARAQIPTRFKHLSQHLEGRDYLLDRFTIADAYLVTVLNWCAPAGVDLAQWPVLQSYYKRLAQRPSVARALGEETALFAEEQKRRAAQ
jgi:glutathione S-transferase